MQNDPQIDGLLRNPFRMVNGKRGPRLKSLPLRASRMSSAIALAHRDSIDAALYEAEKRERAQSTLG